MTTGAFVIIMDGENRVLWCKRRDRDLWNLPGGRVEAGESPWLAALREVREEIDVSVNLTSLYCVNYKKELDDLVFTFIGEISSGTPSLSDEVAEIAYFGSQNMPENISPKQKVRVIDFLSADKDSHTIFRDQ